MSDPETLLESTDTLFEAQQALLREGIRAGEIERDRDEWKRIACARNLAIGTLGQENERLRAACKDAADSIRMFGWSQDERRNERYMVDELREAMELCEKAVLGEATACHAESPILEKLREIRDRSPQAPSDITIAVATAIVEFQKLRFDLAAEQAETKHLALPEHPASLRLIPSAWMRFARIASTPDQPPGEYDVECYAGDDPPEDGNKGWIPLYRRSEGCKP